MTPDERRNPHLIDISRRRRIATGAGVDPSDVSGLVKQFDAIYPRLAKDYNVLFYPFFLDGIVADPKLNLADGMHPNPAGVEVIVARMLPAVETLVRSVSGGS